VPNLSKHRQSPALVALGQVIREIRLEREMSQESLSLIAEIDRSYLGRVERGDNNVAILALIKIAEALSVSVEELMQKAGL